MADLQPTVAPPLSNGAAAAASDAEALAFPPSSGSAAKRQRRPSVRLGEIGGQLTPSAPQEPGPRRCKQQWRVSSHAPRGIPSKIRPLTNLVADDFNSGSGEENTESAPGIRRGNKEGRSKKSGRLSSQRVRANWMPKAEEGAGEGYRDYDELQQEGWESPEKENRERIDADMEMTLETNSRDWQRAQIIPGEDGGVRAWLNCLGLGRYGPVFEIHEVDDEVLPLLTLDDLKDMGINAVGSRRKMFCAIQKLRRDG